CFRLNAKNGCQRLEDSIFNVRLLVAPDAHTTVPTHINPVNERQYIVGAAHQYELVHRLWIGVKILHNQRVNKLLAVCNAECLKANSLENHFERSTATRTISVPIGNGHSLKRVRAEQSCGQCSIAAKFCRQIMKINCE